MTYSQHQLIEYTGGGGAILPPIRAYEGISLCRLSERLSDGQASVVTAAREPPRSDGRAASLKLYLKSGATDGLAKVA